VPALAVVSPRAGAGALEIDGPPLNADLAQADEEKRLTWLAEGIGSDPLDEGPDCMPLYAYQCEKCGHEEEHIQRFSDDPITECEVCGGPTKRLITGTAFKLKGGGWYADGYASSGGGGSSSDSGGGSSDSGGSSKASGE
jgi:putative FmdB family regulatory protein